MWKKTKWARKQLTQQACLPPLKDGLSGPVISEPGPKAELLLRTFFPLPIEADLNNINEIIVYPDAYTMEPITSNEIKKAI